MLLKFEIFVFFKINFEVLLVQKYYLCLKLHLQSYLRHILVSIGSKMCHKLCRIQNLTSFGYLVIFYNWWKLLKQESPPA